MLEPEQISTLFGAAAGVWALGFSWGKCVAWIRALRNAA